MSIVHKIFLATIFFVVCIGGASEFPKASAAVELTGTRAAQDIIKLTNRERIQRNLPPLRVDRHCVSAITSHVNEMARGRFLSHQGRDGRARVKGTANTILPAAGLARISRTICTERVSPLCGNGCGPLLTAGTS